MYTWNKTTTMEFGITSVTVTDKLRDEWNETGVYIIEAPLCFTNDFFDTYNRRIANNHYQHNLHGDASAARDLLSAYTKVIDCINNDNKGHDFYEKHAQHIFDVFYHGRFPSIASTDFADACDNLVLEAYLNRVRWGYGYTDRTFPLWARNLHTFNAYANLYKNRDLFSSVSADSDLYTFYIPRLGSSRDTNFA